MSIDPARWSLTDKSEQLARHQAALLHIGTQALGDLNLDSLFQEALRMISENLAADICLILEHEPASSSLTLRACVGCENGSAGISIFDSQQNLQAVSLLQSPEPILLDDLRDDPLFSKEKFFQTNGVVKGISVKVGEPTNQFGVLGAFFKSSRTVSEDEMNYLKSFADLLSAAIQRQRADYELIALNTNLEKQVATQAKLINLLEEVTLATNNAASISDAFRAALGLICAFTSWPLGHVYYLNPGSDDELLPSNIWSFNQPDLYEPFRVETEKTRLKFGQALPGAVLAQYNPVWSNDLSQPGFLRHNSAEACGLKAGFAIPVTIHTKLFAVLEFFNNEPIEPDSAVLEALNHIGAQLGRVLQRRFQEEEIQASQMRLAEAQRLARLGNWEWDILTDQMHWSEEMYYILGEQVETKTPTYQDFINYIHSDDRPAFVDTLQKACSTQKSFELEFRIVRADGVVRILHSRGNVMANPSGKVSRVFGVSQDNTEQKLAENMVRASESRFRAIYEGTATGISILDQDQRIISANPALQKMLGYSFDELAGKKLNDIVHPQTYHAHKQLYESIFSGMGSPVRLEQQLLGKNGAIWANTQFSTIRREDSSLFLAIWIIEDITTKKQLEAELAEVQKRLVISREKERLHLAQELHDEPLQELYGLSYQLEDFLNNMADYECAQELHSAPEAVKRVISSLRAMCQELRPPTLVPFGLEGTLRELANRYRSEHPEIQIHLDLMDDGQSLPEHVRLTLYRVAQHALINVARHAQASEIRIKFHFNEEHCSLEIEDNGSGFVVPPRWVSLVRGGHLGLAGAAERVELLDGIFQVHSSPGKGTRVLASIPLS